MAGKIGQNWPYDKIFLIIKTLLWNEKKGTKLAFPQMDKWDRRWLQATPKDRKNLQPPFSAPLSFPLQPKFNKCLRMSFSPPGLDPFDFRLLFCFLLSLFLVSSFKIHPSSLSQIFCSTFSSSQFSFLYI